jgi:hypothetical protein
MIREIENVEIIVVSWSSIRSLEFRSKKDRIILLKEENYIGIQRFEINPLMLTQFLNDPNNMKGVKHVAFLSRFDMFKINALLETFICVRAQTRVSRFLFWFPISSHHLLILEMMER